MTSDLRRQNQDLFTRGGMRQQTFVRQAREAGVPTVAETKPEISPWETGVLGGLAHFISPQVLAAALPVLAYNRPGMTATQALIENAWRAAGPAGALGGQAAATLDPRQPPTR